MGVPVLRVDNRVAVVTGAARGIGAAYARGLAEAGGHVVLVDVDAETGREVADAITADGLSARFIDADIADAGSVSELAAKIVDECGNVSILVNNAALEGAPTPVPFEDLDSDHFDRVMAVNVKGMWLLAQALVPGMKELGGGAIVNQSSIGAFVGYPTTTPYTASKMAVIGVTKVMARELGRHNIRVNCIAPGVVATESVMSHASPELIEQTIANQCLPSLQQPSDMVGPLLFLVTGASQFITGQTLIVDGGVVLSP